LPSGFSDTFAAVFAATFAPSSFQPRRHGQKPSPPRAVQRHDVAVVAEKLVVDLQQLDDRIALGADVVLVQQPAIKRAPSFAVLQQRRDLGRIGA